MATLIERGPMAHPEDLSEARAGPVHMYVPLLSILTEMLPTLFDHWDSSVVRETLRLRAELIELRSMSPPQPHSVIDLSQIYDQFLSILTRQLPVLCDERENSVVFVAFRLVASLIEPLLASFREGLFQTGVEPGCEQLLRILIEKLPDLCNNQDSSVVLEALRFVARSLEHPSTPYPQSLSEADAAPAYGPLMSILTDNFPVLLESSNPLAKGAALRLMATLIEGRPRTWRTQEWRTRITRCSPFIFRLKDDAKLEIRAAVVKLGGLVASLAGRRPPRGQCSSRATGACRGQPTTRSCSVNTGRVASGLCLGTNQD
jgi:hypothetical protein